MFSNIVVGVDGSDTSDNAVRIACDLAGRYDSALYLVHTPRPQTVAFAMGAVAGIHAATTVAHHGEEVGAAGRGGQMRNAIGDLTAQRARQPRQPCNSLATLSRRPCNSARASSSWRRCSSSSLSWPSASSIQARIWACVPSFS